MVERSEGSRRRRGACLVLAVAVLSTGVLGAARPSLAGAPPAPPRPSTPSAPLPGLPTVARVLVEVAPAHVLVVQDIALPRGEGPLGPFRFYVAFGAPGAPRAFDAQLLPWPSPPASPGWPLAVERLPRKPSWAALLLGAPTKSGAVVHVPDALFRSLSASSGEAMLRLRALHVAPTADEAGARSVLVRLGVMGGFPLTVERVVVAAAPGAPAVTRLEAHFCGPRADDHPLAVTVGERRPAVDERTIAPALATRHEGDELCVKYVTSSPGEAPAVDHSGASSDDELPPL